jgi:hypothetical protein
VLECLGRSLACSRVGDDGDVTAARPVRPALRLLPVLAACMAASCCSRVTWRFISPHASVVMLAPCVWAHVLVGFELVMRGGDLSCKAETCSSCGKLVGDAFDWLRTGRLASEGLDEDLHPTTQVDLQVNGGLLLDVVVNKGTAILKLLVNEQWTPPRR